MPTLEEILDEFLARQRCGEAPTVAEYVQRYPHLAQEIQGTVPALRLMVQLGPAGEDATEPSLAAASTETIPRDQIDDYRILGEIGRGGMGVVYEAEQLSLGRHVALKVLTRPMGNSTALLRFRREARAAAQLHHTNIVPVFEVGQTGDCVYYTMQLIRGHGLDVVIAELRRLRQGLTPDGRANTSFNGLAISNDHDRFTHRLKAELQLGGYHRAVAEIGVQAASALAYAHARGIVHRDVKPSNLLLDHAGVTWLTDFGLAKTGEEGISQPGDVVGTLRYLPPERLRGQCDGRGDVYSLGLTLYELLLLRPAFQAHDHVPLVQQIGHVEPTRPREVNAHVPRDLETIILKAIDKDAARRYQSADDLAADLRRFLDGYPIHARRTPALERLAKWARRYPATAALYLLVPLVILLGGLGGGATWLWSKAETAYQEAEQGRAAARTAKEEATRAWAEAEQQRRLAEKTAYLNRVMRAHFEWLENDAPLAEQLLNECPERWRDWEWHYVRGLCHTELRTLAGARQPLTCIASSPDGKRIVCGGKEGGVFHWEADQPCRLLAGHAGRVWSVSFSPDGSHFMTTSDDGATIWHDATGQRLHVLKGHKGGVSGCCYSPDGRHVATASTDRTVVLWDAQDGQVLRTLKASGPLRSVGFDSGGKRVAAVTADRGTLHVWDPVSGTEVHTMPTLSAPAALCWSPAGDRLTIAAHSGHQARTWDTRTWQLLHVLNLPTPAYVWDLRYSPDGRQLALATSDRRVLLWDAQDGSLLRTIQGHSDQVAGLSYVNSGHLASASWDGTVKVWDPDRDQQATTIRTGETRVQGIGMSRDGGLLACANPQQVETYDLLTASRVMSLADARGTGNVCFSPDGKRLATGDARNGQVRIWEVPSGRQVYALSGHGHYVDADFSPDGQLLASTSQDGDVHLWHASTGESVHHWQMGHPASVVCFSLDGRHVAVGGGGAGTGIVRVWDVETRQDFLRLNGHQYRVTCLCYSPDGRLLATGSADQLVRLWHADSGKPVFAPLTGHRSYVGAVCFSPDGTRLFSSGWDKTIRVWDVASGQSCLVLKGHPGRIENLCITPDGKRLASADAVSGIVRLWHAPDYVPKR